MNSVGNQTFRTVANFTTPRLPKAAICVDVEAHTAWASLRCGRTAVRTMRIRTLLTTLGSVKDCSYRWLSPATAMLGRHRQEQVSEISHLTDTPDGWPTIALMWQ